MPSRVLGYVLVAPMVVALVGMAFLLGGFVFLAMPYECATSGSRLPCVIGGLAWVYVVGMVGMLLVEWSDD